jgi:hypothetical protein
MAANTTFIIANNTFWTYRLTLSSMQITQWNMWKYPDIAKPEGHGFDSLCSSWDFFFFSWPNLSSRTTVMRSPQPLTEMSTRNFLGGRGRQAHKADNLIAICETTVWKMWDLWRHTNLSTSTACCKDSFTFYMIGILSVPGLFFIVTLNKQNSSLSTRRTGECPKSDCCLCLRVCVTFVVHLKLSLCAAVLVVWNNGPCEYIKRIKIICKNSVLIIPVCKSLWVYKLN